ncbi:MAG: histone deacetylase family protein [Alphaproteobacteria bacterium]|nr:histone deacetylase family protein [Alphaproteobacteria bacterium]
MTTLLYTHTACLEHDPSPRHPEAPARLRAVLAALEEERFAMLERREAPLAERAWIARVHPAEFVDALLAAIPREGYAAIDADTLVSPGSGEAALRAAGAVVAAVDAVANGEADNAFCAVRPPGHHAEPTRSMGFCLFNNVAVGALHARAAHGHRRVAVVDFDVHHGNGTQAMFVADADLFYASTHQMPLYPGTGEAGETGVAGNIVNVPLPPGAGTVQFRAAMERIVLPALDEFAPDFLLISAGFDAHAADPLANLRLTTGDFAWATTELLAVAQRHCGGRVVSTLEGGYDLGALGKASAAHVHALMTA